MSYILGIESSCDETAVAVYDRNRQKIIAHHLFSQIQNHLDYGGVVPEIASRSHLEKIHPLVAQVLESAQISLSDLSAVAVTSKPGLAGSLLVGFSFAKAVAWTQRIPLIPVNHLAGHIFSSHLNSSGARQSVPYPHLCLSMSGGHSSLYIVTGPNEYTEIATTRDDAGGEAFDKIGRLIGLGYPGGAIIERYARMRNFTDFYHYPRTKLRPDEYFFSFSGLKTAVLYDLAKRGFVDLKTGKRTPALTQEVQEMVASSLLVCIADIIEKTVRNAFAAHPGLAGVTFVGGVACNAYICDRLQKLCATLPAQPFFTAVPRQFSTDNGAMIALVGEMMLQAGHRGAPLSCDIF